MGSRNPIFDLSKRGWAKTSKPAAKPSSKLALPSVDALASAAYEAADTVIQHYRGCRSCGSTGPDCGSGIGFAEEYYTKRDKALKAIRRREAITQMINGEAVPPKASPSSPSPTRRKGVKRG